MSADDPASGVLPARTEEGPGRAPGTRAEVAAHLADLARLYDLAEPETRQRLAQALFARVEVLGPTKVWLYPSEEAMAQGWATVMSGEFTAQVRRNGRGERGSASLTHLRFRPRFVLENVTPAARSVWPVVERKAG